MVHDTKMAITCHGVGVRYGAHQALWEVSGGISSGRITVLLGHNGSGKSTLLSVLAGLRTPDAGTLRRSHTARPALVVQRSAVPDTLPMTVRQAVTMGRWGQRGAWKILTKKDKEIVARCMRRLDIAHLANRQLGQLSGGQRQRVMLAQGIAQRGDVMLLDEPDAGLDTDSRAVIVEVLRGLRDEGAAIVVATHDQDLAGHGDVRWRLVQGRVAEESMS